MNGYYLSPSGRVWATSGASAEVAAEDMWYVERATGDIMSLRTIIDEYFGESERVDPPLVFGEGLAVTEGVGGAIIATPLRRVFIPPIERDALVLTDANGHAAAEYAVGNTWAHVWVRGEPQKFKFLSPLDRGAITSAHLRDEVDDNTLRRLKLFLNKLVEVAGMWEDL